MKIKNFKAISLTIGILLVIILARPAIWSLITGGIVVILGESIRVWATGHLVRNRELTTSGPYAYLRDPLYLGRFFLLIGFCIMGWGYSLVILPIGLFVFIFNYMPRKYRKEMTNLEKLFGEEYTTYASYCRSLMPRLKPYSNARKRKWSFSILWSENREQYFLIGVIFVFLAIIFRFALMFHKI